MQDFSVTLRCDGARLHDLSAWLRRFAIKNPGHRGTWFCFHTVRSQLGGAHYVIGVKSTGRLDVAKARKSVLVHDFEYDVDILVTVIE